MPPAGWPACTGELQALASPAPGFLQAERPVVGRGGKDEAARGAAYKNLARGVRTVYLYRGRDRPQFVRRGPGLQETEGRQTMKFRFIGAMLALLVSAPLATVQAQGAKNYPDHPIHLVAPYAPGGGTDLLARRVAQELTRKLGQSVVVDNKPGAGGMVGAQYTVSAPPDGYTLMLTAPAGITVLPHMTKNMSYNALRDLAPITLITSVPALLVVTPSLPVHSVKELIAYAKANPGKLSFGSSGIGGTAQLAGEMMKTMAHLDMVHVPYRGTGPANQALVAGQVQVSFGDIIATSGLVKGGQLRALAVTSAKRSPLFPDLPAIAETLPGYDAGVWYGLFAPAKTPKPVIDKINTAMREILAEPDFKTWLSSLGGEPVGDSPAQFAKFLKEDSEVWGKVISEAHITANE
jgi:tripartite-type tricarboxylate transporter receptor subunit TctC